MSDKALREARRALASGQVGPGDLVDLVGIPGLLAAISSAGIGVGLEVPWEYSYCPGLAPCANCDCLVHIKESSAGDLFFACPACMKSFVVYSCDHRFCVSIPEPVDCSECLEEQWRRESISMAPRRWPRALVDLPLSLPWTDEVEGLARRGSYGYGQVDPADISFHLLPGEPAS